MVVLRGGGGSGGRGGGFWVKECCRDFVVLFFGKLGSIFVVRVMDGVIFELKVWMVYSRF